MWNNSNTFLGCDSNYRDARIVLFGAPFDGTTSYRPGTRFASRIMRAESYGLETYSPYQDLDLSETEVFDGGDLELSYGDTEKALKTIREATEQILLDHKLPFLIGGEHLVSLPVVQALSKKYSDLQVIHFDAHADLRDDYLGAKLSHATVLRRIWDEIGDGRIWQFGIRSGEREEFAWAKEHTRLHKFNFGGLEETIMAVAGKPVYLTVDLDVLDPSCFLGTGTPEAGGVTFTELLGAVQMVIAGCQMVGCDMVELSPPLDQSGASTTTALKLLREMLLALEVPFIRLIQV